jgi:hypothetical protein
MCVCVWVYIYMRRWGATCFSEPFLPYGTPVTATLITCEEEDTCTCQVLATLITCVGLNSGFSNVLCRV